jgi:N-acetylneuraminic acid mutarotase
MRYRVFRSGGYNNSGVSLAGGTVTAPISLSGNPTQPLQAVPKQYVDSKLLSLDASNFTTGMISVARLPGFTGDVTSTPGSTVLNLVNTGVVAGTYTKFTVDTKGRVTFGTTLTSADIPNLDWSKITSGKPTTVSGYGITNAITTSGGTITGTLNIQNTPVANNDIANKQYVDDIVNGNQYAVGDVILKPYTTTPPGFLKCNGAMVSKTTYSNLYAVIGDTYTNYGSSGVAMPGIGKPWKQQYTFNTSQSGDITGWTTESPLPSALAASQAIVTKNRVYLLGGDISGSPSSTIYTAPINANGTLGSWTTAGNLPSNLKALQAVVYRNKVFVFGGFNSTSVYSALINPDGTLGSWVNETPTLIPTGFSQAIVTNNRIYVFGGFSYYVWAYSNTNRVQTAPINPDGSIGNWTYGPDLPLGMSDSQAVVIKNKVYLICGYTDTTSIPFSTIYAADINADGTLGNWTTSGNTPSALAASQAIVTKNRIYLLGGYNSSGVQSTVYTAPINADGTLGTWTTGTPLPVGLKFSQAITTNSKIYLLGGSTSGNTSAVYSASFSGGLNDYSPYYDGTIQPTDPNSFGLPDFTAQDTASNIYHYIKY